MEVKKKSCKGVNKAKNFKGCGNDVYRFRFGLCQSCYGNFLYQTKEGLELVEAAKIKGKITVKKQMKSMQRKQTKEAREALMTKTDWEKRLEAQINRIARQIDKGHNCISSDRPLRGKYDAGHYYSVGSNATLRFNLHNIFAQSVADNQHKGGEPINYIRNIQKHFGIDYASKVSGLQSEYKVLKLAVHEIKTAIESAKKFNKYIDQLRKESLNGIDDKFSFEERIELRCEANIMIGIYEENF